MRTFQLHILAADRVFFEGECESVVAPTASGQYGVQAHHSNMIAAISPGELTFRTAQGETRYAAVSAGRGARSHFAKEQHPRIPLGPGRAGPLHQPPARETAHRQHDGKIKQSTKPT